MDKFILLIALFSVSLISVADAYKCSQDGKMVYADHPCGSESEAIKIAPGVADNQRAKDDYSSVEKQLERLDREKAEIKLERKQKNLADEGLRIKKKQAESGKNIDQAECEYYRARVREEENNLSKGYQSREHRLSDESYLSLLRKSAAEYCHY